MANTLDRDDLKTSDYYRSYRSDSAIWYIVSFREQLEISVVINQAHTKIQ